MITLFDASKFKTRFACEIKGFEPTDFLDRKEARKIDRFAQIALVASDQAVAGAGISKDNVDSNRMGLSLRAALVAYHIPGGSNEFCKRRWHTTLQSLLYSENDP
jgi:3-oxoacyl-(acyl-carrier-protein) synthase